MKQHSPSLLLPTRAKGSLHAILIGALLLTLPTMGASAGRKYDPETPTGYRWPTDASRRMTSTFGEPRPDRFHAAIDFSTNGGVGFPCYAIDNGSVIRVKANFKGYGRVVYLEIPGSRVAVYAHLSRFEDRVEERVRAEQIRQGKYEVELFFEKGEISLGKGDVIGYSGDTGAGPAHLHFELREGLGTPYNPTLDGFIVPDSQPPVIRRVAIKALDGSSEVDSDVMPVIQRVSSRKAAGVDVFGMIGISAEVVDFQDGGWHRLGPRRIELYLDGTLLHVTDLERFRYRDNRDSRLDFDYELQKRGYARFRRLYIVPGNNLPFYDRSLPGGIIDTRRLKTGEHEIRIRALDDQGNESSITMPLNVLRGPTLPPADAAIPMPPLPEEAVLDTALNMHVRIFGETARLRVKDVPEGTRSVQIRIPQFSVAVDLVDRGETGWVGRVEIPLTFRGWTDFVAVVKTDHGLFRKTGRLRLAGFLAGLNDRWSMPEENFEVRIGPGGLWYDLVLGMTKRKKTPEILTDQVQLHPYDYPYQRPFEVVFNTDDEPWPEKAVIVFRDWKKGGRWTYLGNEREMNGFVLKAESYSNETFSVMLDTLAPKISGASYSEGAVTSRRKPLLAIDVTDELSGIDLEKVRFTVNGESVIWEYDPDADKISYRPWDNLPRGKHTWKIVVPDMVGNAVSFESTIRVK